MSLRVAARNRKILDAALDEACACGFYHMRRDAIAERAGVAVGGINNAFGTMAALSDAVMQEALTRVSSTTADTDQWRAYAHVIAQGMAGGHKLACDAPPEIKALALATLA